MKKAPLCTRVRLSQRVAAAGRMAPLGDKAAFGGGRTAASRG